ncbi:MAG: helix-turn-helix domain-containing protein [Pyrinomonadaceae bacterium]
MDDRVQAVIAYMRSNLHRELSLSQVARKVNLSPSRLSKLFHVEMDTSPMHYLHHVRMEEARLLVETTFLSPKQIMVRVGINDESHFVRDFKRDYGLPPVQYRLRFRNNSIGEEEHYLSHAVIFANG